MQEKTDNDDMSKAVKLNFIEEMTLFSPVCTRPVHETTFVEYQREPSGFDGGIP